jgi:hypothetical protein
MGSLSLSEADLEIIQESRLLWSQRVINNAKRILDECATDEDVQRFFTECEAHVKRPADKCRITFNTEIHGFGGDEFGYCLFFLSQTLGVVIKVAVRFELMEQVITIGQLEIATKKEEGKYQRHIKEHDHTTPEE